MNKLPFHIAAVTCILSSVVVSAIAQTAVPIEKEPMHRLKFENEFVRLFDVLVPAGATTQYQIHSFDAISFPLSDPKLVDVSISGERKKLDPNLRTPTFGPRPLPQTHSVVNSGKVDFRNIFIEPRKDPLHLHFRSFRMAMWS